ncbi:hypothetical protein B0H16DRAFT_1262233, partial [Mycena metata]
MLRTLIQPYTERSVADRVSLLDVCAQLCAQHEIDFSLLLQGKFENHTALYWAIANGPWPPKPPFELAAAVLAHSAPLKPETMKEARRACVSLRSQELFHFLRMSPEFGTLSAEDQFLLGVSAPPEEIVVEELEGPTHPFSFRFQIPQFHKRMMLGKPITLEVVARGRLWRLKYYTANKPSHTHLTHGYWTGLLSMVENSAMT